MARPLRLSYPGALYHVTARGNARQAIYTDDADRQIFLSVLEDVVARYHWLCHAYCLMDNHYHLLLETPEENLSAGMRQVNGVYTQRFNRRHGRVGHVFQGLVKAILVEPDRYLLELCRYVVLNPMRAGIVRPGAGPLEQLSGDGGAGGGTRVASPAVGVSAVQPATPPRGATGSATRAGRDRGGVPLGVRAGAGGVGAGPARRGPQPAAGGQGKDAGNPTDAAVGCSAGLEGAIAGRAGGHEGQA